MYAVCLDQETQLTKEMVTMRKGEDIKHTRIPGQLLKVKPKEIKHNTTYVFRQIIHL